MARTSALTTINTLLLVAGGAYVTTYAPASRAQSPAKLHCEPTCRVGFECRMGECVPRCDPACGSGFVCSEQGECLPEASAGPRAPAASAHDALVCRPSCRAGYTCLDGACVSECNPPCPLGQSCTAGGYCTLAAEPEEPDEEYTPERSITADSIVNLHVNSLGLFQLGLNPTVELGTWISGYLRVQPMNTGLVSYFLLQRDDEDKFVWGLGTTLGAHIFSAGDGNMRGVYGGAGLGYFYMLNRDKKIDHAQFGTHMLVPQLDAGYRWVFGHFLVSPAGRIGLSIPVGKHDQGLGGAIGCTFPRSCDEKRSVRFLGELALDVGVMF